MMLRSLIVQRKAGLHFLIDLKNKLLMPLKTNRLAKYFCTSILLLWTCSLLAQKTVTGRVTSSTDKQPLAGASVQVRGSKAATTSDANGNFQINVPSNKSVLQISVVGFERMEIPVADKTDLGEITLTATSTTLNDV